jgi:hypothetical protein
MNMRDYFTWHLLAVFRFSWQCLDIGGQPRAIFGGQLDLEGMRERPLQATFPT